MPKASQLQNINIKVYHGYGHKHNMMLYGHTPVSYTHLDVYKRQEKILDRIMVVDLDVHQGNGTASIFKNEPRVFTFSMHGQHNYPFRKEESDLDVGLPDCLLYTSRCV